MHCFLWHERIAKVYGTSTYPKAKEGAMQRYDAMARKSREWRKRIRRWRGYTAKADEAPQ